jgi:hypothetical protein
MKQSLLVTLLLLSAIVQAQVKVGNNPGTINSNSILELESTNKGFLPPRVTLNSLSSVAPLSGTVPAGMLLFSSGGSVSDGYYYWDGAEWKKLDNGNKTLVTKSASATLAKGEHIVLASNDITLTLPAVTALDNGLEITVKNTGSHTDLITIIANGASLIDGVTTSTLTKNCGQTFIASGGNWVIRDKTKKTENMLDVNANSSWQTIEEAIEFLNAHMSGPSVIRLGEEVYDVTETIDIDLPYALTIQGLSYSSSIIAASSGLTGKPMFRCNTDCYFKMLAFDATTLSGYGTAAGEDAIRFVGQDTYNEIKDCSFDRFYNTILDSSNAELWVFETDISNAQRNGILVHSGDTGVIVKVAETDFIGCSRGISLDKAVGATIQLASGGYYNNNATDTAIIYRATTFKTYNSISIKGNLWNNTGKFIEGFDFTRSDGRDADIILESNAGKGDSKPQCFINVINSVTTKTLTTTGTWYKADWGSNTSFETCKWGIASNRITYQPVNIRNGVINVAGNLSVNSNNQNISIGIVKNGNTAVRYGETTLRVTTQDQPYQFSFIAYLSDIQPGDYFEIYYSNSSSGSKIVTIQDIQFMASAQ